MYSLNINKMQQLPRGKDGVVPPTARRVRLPITDFETKPFQGRAALLRPTKGWLARNIIRMANHGKIVQDLDHLRQQANHRMIVAREERKKQKAK